jgi:phage virion morphogenesis protein
MTDITLDIDAKRTRATLHGLAGRLDDATPLMFDIGELLVESTKQRFQAGMSPAGIPWPENSPLTLSRKKGTRPLIGETHRLSNEIISAPTSDSVTMGSNLIYARTQQEGALQGAFGHDARNHPIPWGDIPARQFIGLSDQDGENILDTVQEYLAEPFDGAAG